MTISCTSADVKGRGVGSGVDSLPHAMAKSSRPIETIKKMRDCILPFSFCYLVLNVVRLGLLASWKGQGCSGFPTTILSDVSLRQCLSRT